MAEKKKMSVAEILAAARKTDSQQGASSGAEQPPAETPTPPAGETAPAEPAAAPPAAADKPAAPAAGGRPSVKDIMAMARAQKAAGAAPSEAKAPPAKPAPAAKPSAKAADKPAASKPAAGATPPRDTASILAAARQGTKPGPVSKSEAQAKASPAAPPAEKPGKPAVPPMPQRPTFSKPKSETAGEERRWFLGIMFGSAMAAGFTFLAATAGLWSLGLARFMFPNILTEPPSRFKVGFKNDFPTGTVDERFKAQFGVWIVNTEYNGRQEIVALRTVCTHLGCTPNWLEAEQKFKCPCHGSGFYKDGINFEGPAPRPLERYAIAIADDGQLEVDKSKLFQEEMGQWNDPNSFVPA